MIMMCSKWPKVASGTFYGQKTSSTQGLIFFQKGPKTPSAERTALLQPRCRRRLVEENGRLNIRRNLSPKSQNSKMRDIVEVTIVKFFTDFMVKNHLTILNFTLEL